MANLAAWLGVGVAGIALAVAYFTYTSQRGLKRLEYVTIYRSAILPARLASDLQVTFKEKAIADPSLVIIRVVNTGDRAVVESDYSTALSIAIDGVKIVSASVSAARPADLRPNLEIDGGRIMVLPTLLNPRDMLEVQVLASGRPAAVAVEGRIADLSIKPRSDLPYPPGSGREGELLFFDKIMWTVPEVVLFAILTSIVALGDFSMIARITIIFGLALLFFVAYPLQVQRLIRRRRMWATRRGTL